MSNLHRILSLLVLCGLAAAATAAPQVQMELPLKRVAYQTNEQIDVTVVRTDTAALPAGTLTLALSGKDGGRITCEFPDRAAAVQGQAAVAVEHIRLNGAMLRPGSYTVTVTADGATATGAIEVYSHLPRSTYAAVRWGWDTGNPRLIGPDSLGFSINYGNYQGGPERFHADDESIRSGLQAMPWTVLGGGHQQDMRLECDWSDPYVLRGDAARVARATFAVRTFPNIIGVHLHDEPGLTWWLDPVTNKPVPHNIPAQDRAYKFAFGTTSPRWNEVKPEDPASVNAWMDRSQWKLSFIESAWRVMDEKVRTICPDYFTVNQHMYGWYAYGDGYYFNVGRRLAVLNGHGGYDTGNGFTPAVYLAMGRARNYDKPAWYLPTFSNPIPSNMVKNEHYQTFMHSAGIMIPLWEPSLAKADSTAGLIESNHLLARLGTILDHLPATRSQVAVLYSLSHALHYQAAKDIMDGYNGGYQREKLTTVVNAGQVSHYDIQPVVEEEVLDGTVSANYRAIILTGITYLDPKVIAALEEYARHGGLVLCSEDVPVKVAGARPLGKVDDYSFSEGQRVFGLGFGDATGLMDTDVTKIDPAVATGKNISAALGQAGIAPILGCDEPEVWVTRQAGGDVEYLFTDNAKLDRVYSDLYPGAGMWDALTPATTTLRLPNDGRPVYDAVVGGPAPFSAKGKELTASVSYGPGQLRVFARTARPIGGVRVLTPVIVNDPVKQNAPVTLSCSAAVTDTTGQVLNGAIPLRVVVTDPLGDVRYDLYRATDHGTLTLVLPLAANDPAGAWKIAVTELLADSTGNATFNYQPATGCGAIAAAVPRAIAFGDDRDKIYRFFREHSAVTLVKGSSPYLDAAAVRITEMLKTWGVQVTTVKAADVNHGREVSAEEAPALVGLNPGKVSPGKGQSPEMVGFDVAGPSILLGSQADNPLIASVAGRDILAYHPSPTFPGAGRGMLAWLTDGVTIGQPSVAVIGSDEAGISEAVGTLYDTAHGLDPLMAATPPTRVETVNAAKPQHLPQAATAWETRLPYRADSVKWLRGGHVAAMCADGTLVAIDGATGKERWKHDLPPAEFYRMDASSDGKRLAVGVNNVLRIYDSGGKSVAETKVNDYARITSLAWSPDGKTVVVGAEGGLVVGCGADGTRRWTQGDDAFRDYMSKNIAFREAAEPWRKAEFAWSDGMKNTDKSSFPPVPKHPIPSDDAKSPTLAVCVNASGTHALALTATKGWLLDLATGAVAASVAGNGRCGIARLGDDFLISDGQSAVRLISVGEKKMTQQLSLPAGASVVGALAGDKGKLFVSTENDESVRVLSGLTGKVEDATVWKQVIPLRAVKSLDASGDRIAAACWGGTLQVLNTTDGTVRTAQMLPQDIAATCWQGTGLVVSLADGRLLALHE